MNGSLRIAQQDHVTDNEQHVNTMQADSFVVVAQDSDSKPVYFPHDTLNEALDDFADIERGEYKSLPAAIGIFPAKNGMPLGSHFSPHYIQRLMRETRAA